ncbi:MAG: ABC transporter substrate-binding protein [Lachnospiraceae bacterium]|nr:ABC transporter substrate-binding protein [Lachnospiraceae bacterium]
MKNLKWKLLLLLLLAVFASGCSGQGEKPKDERFYEDDVTSEREDHIVVGFAQIGSESDYRIANSASFRETFCEKNGYYLLFEDGQQKQENQIKAVRNFILQEVDYIVLDPIVETGWDEVLQEAKSAGIPVILSDRSVTVEDEGLYTCWVGSDFEEEGRMAGLWLENYLQAEGRDEEEIHLVTLQGTPGSSAQIGRTAGFSEILQRHGNWNMLEYASGDFTQSKGQEVMTQFLKSYPDIDVVISENDNMTFGAIEAIEEAGKTCGPAGEIIIISFDAASEASFTAMKEGKLHADVECNPFLAPKVDEIIKRLERGETVEKIQYVEEQCFDAFMDLDTVMEERKY